MPRDDDDKSLSDQQTFSGKIERDDSPQSLGDQATFAGGPGVKDTKSLGDEATFGDAAGGGEAAFDDDMEVVDLSARYTVEGTLGKGGMGEVLLATDTRLNRKVAIKRILGDAAKSRTAVSRFLTEAQSIAALNHPNIVQIYDYGRATDGPFLIMEYVEGRSLLDKCREGAIPLEEAVELMCQLCDGLGTAHEANIIHRDIKPANVLLTKTGIPKLTDFGLAKDETADAGLSVAGAVLGTLDFMPPEQRNDVALTDSRSDLWSLAATLYQMVTGRSPKIIRFNNVPQSLQDVLGKALEDEKDDRYQTAAEFQNALRTSQQDTGSEELEEGSCPSCGTKNPTNRKFCRNEDCGANLQVPCLSCSEEIPMWEGICNSCGAKQRDLLGSRRKQLASQQSKAESLLKNYDFDKSTKLAVAVRDEPDLRLQHLKGWAEKFLPTVEQGRQQQLERIGKLLGEALQHEQASDYASGVHTLGQVPAILRDTKIPQQSQTAGELLEQLREKQSRSQQLDTVIRQRVENRQLNGLQQQVDELLKLCPDRKDIQKLKQQLVDREAKRVTTRDQAVSNAKSLLEKQEYEAAIKELEQVDRHVETDEVRRLCTDATGKRDRMVELQKSIDTAVSEKKWHGLPKRVKEYLELKSDDAKMIALRDRLAKRDKKNAAQVASVLEKAQSLHAECKFDAAVKALEKIPQELQTEECSDLLDSCGELAQQRSKAIGALRKGLESESYEPALQRAQTYASSLETETLEDEEFQRAVKICKQSLKEQQEAEEAADRQRALMKKLAIAGAAVTAVVLLIAAGLWIRSSMNASALAEAVQQQQWDEALALDTTNVPALIGRANQRLTSGDVKGAMADLDQVASLEPDNSSLASLKDLAAKKAEAERILSQRPVVNSIGMQFKLLPGGTFTMGDGDDAHQVTLTKPFGLGVYEVTQQQYEKVMGKNPSKFKAPQNPVEQVIWNDAVEFCRKLSDLPSEKSRGYVYRLPTEAEWEYACRAGTTTKYSFGDSESQLGDYGWYDKNSRKTTHPVGGKKPNPWGLYDMHGNVYEWCQDRSGIYPSGSTTDPTGAASGSDRVIRGGSWNLNSVHCRSAYRFGLTPVHRHYYLGFRVLRSSIK
jgi:formylglycine-generating enzyme required for sulfatase activity/serine/threonine protein kinase